MADNRTGLSASDIAESFRDRCGDGSLEWTYTPMQTWVLLDAADMLDENERLRELLQRTWDAFHGATAREFVTVKNELRELGVEVDA